jgi:hypothetical protein
MPRAKSELTFNNFNGGLNTEAGPFNFPPNAVSDISNLTVGFDGSIRRRLGLDYESGGTVTPYTRTGYADIAFTSYSWSNINNNALLSRSVVQVGDFLYFLDDTQPAPSSSIKATLDLNTIAAGFDYTSVVSLADVDGKLIIAGAGLGGAYYITYTEGSPDVVSTPVAITIEVRDIWGIGIPVLEDKAWSYEPTQAELGLQTNDHTYNMHNQGWPQNAMDIDDDELVPDDDRLPHGAYQLFHNVYPSNAAIWYLGVRPDKDDGYKEFSCREMRRESETNFPAPRGRFIIDFFDRGASREDAVDSPFLANTDIETGSITTVATFNSRVFYSGVSSSVSDGDSRSPDATGMIFFSRLVETTKDLGRCYQTSDPTSEYDSVVVPTDGGVIKIAGSGTINRITELNGRLLVFAVNGVWEIAGPDGVFAADAYSVAQVTEVPTLNPQSVVSVEGTAMYWALGGIYAIQPDPNSGRLNATNMITTVIQSYYNDLPAIAKAECIGFYDEVSKVVRWLHGDDDTSPAKKNAELLLDVRSAAWYPYTIDTSGSTTPDLVGYVEVPPLGTATDSDPVTVNGVDVTVNGADVTVDTTVARSTFGGVKLITAQYNASDTSWTLSDYADSGFVDFNTPLLDGVDYVSYFETGEITGGDNVRQKIIPEIHTQFNRTETGFQEIDGELQFINPSSCLVQAKWGLSDSAASGKWGRQFEAYRYNRNYIPTGTGDPLDYGQYVITTKTRIRGRGLGVRFRMESSSGKDMQLLSWGVPISAESRP